MQQIALTGATLLDPEDPGGIPRAGTLLLDGGRIEQTLLVGTPVPGGYLPVSCAGRLVAPGLIDLHFHGDLIFADSANLDDALARAGASLVRHGTTAYLPTTVAWSTNRLAAFVTQAASDMTQCGETLAQPLGLHLEGPWINPAAAGAQPTAGIRPYRPEELEDLLARGSGAIKMVTFAPEAPGAVTLAETLSQRGILPALGHSLTDDASYGEARRAGMTHVTHLFNAMGAMHHRAPGVAGRVLDDGEVTSDLICDGIHVDPVMVRLAARALGDRLVLVTDQIALPSVSGGGAAARLGGEEVHDDGTALRLPDGRLAGSRLSLDGAIRNAQSFGAADLLGAVAACTLRPARILGIEHERGTLRRGARADLVIFEADGRVSETWIGGQKVFAAGD